MKLQLRKKYSLVDIHTGRPLQVVDHIGCHYAKMFPSKGIGGQNFLLYCREWSPLGEANRSTTPKDDTVADSVSGITWY